MLYCNPMKKLIYNLVLTIRNNDFVDVHNFRGKFNLDILYNFSANIRVVGQTVRDQVPGHQNLQPKEAAIGSFQISILRQD